MSRSALLLTSMLAALSAPSAVLAAEAAAQTGGATTIGELVVTAERRSENLQEVPVAVSAFSQETLKNEKVEGGENLVLQVPNTNYTRSNFGGYNFKIRGIGTDVITFLGTAGVSFNEN